MAVESRAEATWQGDLMSGSGSVKPASGSFPELPLTWKRRAEEREGGTSPEELIAAAEAGCFSMALSHALAQAGHTAERLSTSVTVGFQAGQGITGVHVSVRGRVPGLDAAGFKEQAETAGQNCPVSKALAGTTVTVDAELE